MLRYASPTISDIAREAGVSIATVSRAVNGGSGLGKETRARILEIVRRLNYYPNLQARGLAGNRPDALGVVIPQASEFALSNPYYTELLKGVASRANESERYLVFSFFREETYASMYYHRMAAGIVVLANRTDDPRIAETRQSRIPMVLIPGDPRLEDVPSVDGNSTEGMQRAVEHLLELGHRRLVLLRGPMNSKYTIDRLRSFHRVLARRRIRCGDDSVVEYDFTQEAAYQKVGQLLGRTRPPTAVILMNDFSAMGALRAAKEKGFRVPEDLSVVGFGDVPSASMTDPPLSTIRVPFQEIGYRAADMLLRLVENRRISKRHLCLPAELVIRRSTAPATGG